MPFDFVFHGGSGSLKSEIEDSLNYGVVKMNVDTDTQYAFTRPIVGHMFTTNGVPDRRRGGQQEGPRPAVLAMRSWPRPMTQRVRGVRAPEVPRAERAERKEGE